MSVELLGLAVLMFAVTWPARAIPLLVPGTDHLPEPVQTYLRLIGPAILAALAAVNVVLATDPDGSRVVRLGIDAVAVLVTVAVMAWRRNLLLALLAAVVLVTVGRGTGLG